MNKTLRIWLLAIMGATFFLSPSFAQDRQVSGKVSNENTAQLHGADILLKGATGEANSDVEESLV